MAEKVCCKCKVPKVIGHFAFRCEMTGKRRSECKDCHNGDKRVKFHKVPKSKQKKINRKNKNKYRDWYRELKKSLICIKCLESNAVCLDFHHKDPTTKINNVADLVRKRSPKDLILKEISKCEVLCANCHRKAHFSESN